MAGAAISAHEIERGDFPCGFTCASGDAVRGQVGSELSLVGKSVFGVVVRRCVASHWEAAQDSQFLYSTLLPLFVLSRKFA